MPIWREYHAVAGGIGLSVQHIIKVIKNLFLPNAGTAKPIEKVIDNKPSQTR